MHNRGLLLDRDGVINVDHGYIGSPDRFEFREGIFEFLREMQDFGYRLAILTNQSGVARGYFTTHDYELLTQKMQKSLAGEGILLDHIFVCFEHEDGDVAPYQRASYWRKPNPGMVLDAIQLMNLDRARSAFLGDKLSDMQAALAGGIKTCLWLTNTPENIPMGVSCVSSFHQARDILKTSFV